MNKATDMGAMQENLNEFNRAMTESDERMNMMDEMMDDGEDISGEADDELQKIYADLQIQDIMNGHASAIAAPPGAMVAPPM